MIPFCFFVCTHALAQSIGYSYDVLNRLTQVVYTDGTTVTYTYDPAGNRLTKVVTAPCVFSLSASAVTMTSAAGGGTVDVATGGGCAWTALANNAFVTVTTGASGAGPGTVAYSLDANTTAAERVGTLTIAGQTFTITQAAPPVVPTVSTTAITAVTKTTAASGGTINADGGSPVTARGLCWSTTANPTTAATCTSNGTGTGGFSAAIMGLTAATTYHVRAFATNAIGTAYGADLSFTTRSLTPTVVTVDTFGDLFVVDGNCTLREAIQAANTDTAVDACPAGNGADTIVLPAGTYLLAIAGKNEDANATGDLDILADLTLTGAGAAATIVNGAQLDRVFEIAPSIAVTLSGLTLRDGASYPYRGAGLYNRGNTQLTDVIVTANAAGGSGGGGIANDGVLTLTGSTVSSNSATSGGGIEGGGTLTLQDSVVSGNSSGGGGGGGLAFSGGTLVLTNSTVTNNSTAGSGGGFFSNGTTTLDRSLVAGNSATFGGAGMLNNGTMTIVNSTLSGNASGTGHGAAGGGIYNNGPLTVESSSFYLNTAASDGGAILNRSTATFKRSILAGASANSCGGNTAVTSLGYNLSSDNTCALAGTGDVSNTDPQLGALADNGGPTHTHALLAGSPAIDAGGAGCPPPATDQRGVSRPQGVACDIGAYEREDANVPPSFTPPANINVVATGVGGAVATFTANGNDAEDGVLAAACTPASGSTFPLGTTTVSCTVTDSAGATAGGSFTVTVAPALAQMISPLPDVPLIAATVRFQWSAGIAVAEYRLDIGSTPGGTDLYSQSAGTNLAATVSGLPHNSSQIYLRLGSFVDGGWHYTSYVYTASASYVPWLGLGSAGPNRSAEAPPAPGAGVSTPILADLVSPLPASVLDASTVVFRWTAGHGVSRYAISVGTRPGGDDLLAGEPSAELSVTIAGLPLNGRPVFVRLWSMVDGGWEFKDYIYMTGEQ